MNVRKLALDTLSKCESAAQYANLALDARIKKYNISGDDRSLFTVLVYGTIEHKLTLDYYVGLLSELPEEKIDAQTRNVLRLGLYQIIYMRTKDHAAVNETVALAPQKSRGFVNAILRNYIRRRDSLSLPDRKTEPCRYLSVKYSFPEATCEKLCEAFGEENVESLLDKMNVHAPLTLKANTLRISRDELLERLTSHGINAERTKFAPHGIKLTEGCSYTELESLFGGLFFVQDEASQISTEALDASRGELVMDVCSCPGSKSFGAALSMENEGEIYAFDLSKSKLPLISSGADRLGIGIIAAQSHDGRELIPEFEGKADRVICDVPCSGFGVVAKKPDIRYKDISAAENLPRIQYDILETASRYLRVGGVMVYSTCTILPEENEENVKKFLAEHEDFELAPFSSGALDVPEGMITLLPHVHDTDGFFIAKLVKTK